MAATENKEYLFSCLSEEVRELNKLLIETGFDGFDFDGNHYSNGVNSHNFDFNEQQKSLLDSIIKNIPEWKRLQGCQQHDIHDFCLDIHTLCVIKKIKESKDYKELENFDRLIVLYSGLLHDIEKNENEIDPEHPAKGAKKSSSILYRLGFSEDFINSVYLLINYHQMIGLIASGRVSIIPDKYKTIFKNEKLLTLQKILSIADIKSVKRNESFLKEKMVEHIEEIAAEIKKFL